MPEIRVRLAAMARMALNCRSVMRWSELRGKMILNCFFLGLTLSGSKGFLMLYSCLIREARTVETDCCSMSQHSTSSSDLIGVPVEVLDVSAFFARALRFPTGLLVSIMGYRLIGLVLISFFIICTKEKTRLYLRYALVLSLVCAFLRAAASLVPVQSSSLLLACKW
jgi:hypothetical protein